MFGFEKKYVNPDEIDQGLLPPKYMGTLTLLLFILFIATSQYLSPAFNWVQYSVWGALALLSARLLVIDLSHLLLLNIYVLPLAILGLIAGPYIHHITYVDSLIGLLAGAAIAFGLYGLMRLLSKTADFGMGDLKLIIAIGPWLGVFHLMIAIGISSIVALIMSLFFARNQPMPFGPALIVSLWIMLLGAPYIESLLFRLSMLIH